MRPSWLEYALFALTYVPTGPLAWLGYAYAAVAGHTKLRLLDKPRPTPPEPPTVSLMIPAKDEAGRIRACLRSALDQDYPAVQVIAVDDRSDDATGTIMDEMAAADPRLTVLHVPREPLPPRWTGKNHALHLAAGRATGRWLLFVDSDVILDPAAVRRTVLIAQYKKWDLLSLMPRLECHRFWEALLIPLHAACASTMYLIALVNNDHYKKVSFANGQFLMMPRTVYDTIGGHEAVRDKLCEDVELGRLVKEHGLRSRVAWGADLAKVRMYDTLPAIVRGWARIYYAAKLGRPREILFALQFLMTCCLPAYPVLAYGLWRLVHPHGNWLDYGWAGAAGFHLLLMTGVVALMYRWSRNSPLYALGLPVAGTVLAYTLCKALVLCATKKVEWRGTSYSHAMNTMAAKQA